MLGEHAFPHLYLDFLSPPRDKSGKTPDQEDYDPSTLKVPSSFLDDQTPGMRQWWDLKADNFDSILFFKMGKFYELFHMDAVTAVEACDLIYMKKDIAHCGFPESAFQLYADQLVDRGHRVIRIEQTETPAMMAVRCKSLTRPTKFDKVVRREVCQKLSAGTRITAPNESDDSLHALVAIDAVTDNDDQIQVAMCVFYPQLGDLFIGSFDDDSMYSKVSAIFGFVKPSEVVFNKKGNAAFKRQMRGYPCLRLSDETFPASSWIESKPDLCDSLQDYIRNLSSGAEELEKMALGALVKYLTDSLVASEMLNHVKVSDLFELYVSVKPETAKFASFYGDSLQNMDILPRPNLPLSLLQILDSSCFPPGRRLLKQWVSRPLFVVGDILKRQDAIKCLNSKPELAGKIRKLLKSVGDLEKKLCYISSLSVEKDPKSADARAIIYDEKKIKKSMTSISSITSSMRHVLEIFNSLLKNRSNISSDKIQSIMINEDELKTATQVCEQFSEIISGNGCEVNIPFGFDSVYDKCKADLANHEKKAKKYLKEEQERLGSDVKFWGNGTAMYQLEVSEKLAKNMSKCYILSSQKKGFKRYNTRETNALRERHLELEEALKAGYEGVCKSILRDFATHNDLWRTLTERLSILDCLLCLERYSFQQDDAWCLPVFVEDHDPIIKIVNGRHPILIEMSEKGQFIPNSIQLRDKLAILTGPNMGGKSTTMRQTGLLVVLAQLGCRVPADEMRLTPIDGLFTRMGARDGIFEGESTFFVELSETVQILRHATDRSLVLIDELGRGTSTHDGCAIALATIKKLAGKCFGIFSTHYHEMISMINCTDLRSKIDVFRMAVIEPSPTQKLTYLYQLEEGECSLSHGFSTALSAGIPQSIVDMAQAKAKLILVN